MLPIEPILFRNLKMLLNAFCDVSCFFASSWTYFLSYDPIALRDLSLSNHDWEPVSYRIPQKMRSGMPYIKNIKRFFKLILLIAVHVIIN